MSGAPPQCSIVITTWQRSALLLATLDSLARQTESAFEVLVVCDGEDPATRVAANDYTAQFNLRWIFHPENLGQGVARNTGALAADADILLFLDDDSPAHPELVAQHLKHYRQRQPGTRITVYGKIIEDRIAPLPLATDQYLQEWWKKVLDGAMGAIGACEERSVGDDYERSINLGLNSSIRRDEFLTSGGFQPKLRYQEEDIELALRLYRSGVQFEVEPQAIVYHRNTKPVTEWFRRSWYLGGKVNAERIFELGERNPQTQHIAGYVNGGVLKRLSARTFWHARRATPAVVKALEAATNLTRSRLLFGAWARVAQHAEFWRGAEDAGFTPKGLNRIAGEPGCAVMLHSLCQPDSAAERTYYLSPARFRRFLDWMKLFGYESADPADWFAGRFSRKRILFTFDDGYDDLYTQLLPMVVERRLKPLLFLVADPSYTSNVWDHTRGLRRRNLLTLQQIREMQRYGVEFGSHTISHPWLPSLSDCDLRREVCDSKKLLEDKLGSAVRAFAYPFGGIDQRVRGAVAEAGYEMAFTTMPGLNWWNDPLCLRRADVNENNSLLDDLLRLRTGYDLREWIAARVRALENGLPTNTLRSAVKAIHHAARPLFLRSYAAPPPPQ